MKNGGNDFKKFAFESHVDAYWNAGLYKLETLDLVKIVLTPDAKDLFSKDGLNQVVKIMGKFKEYWKKHPEEFLNRVGEGIRDRSKIRELIEDKAEKEGVPIITIKKILKPLPLKL